MTMKTIRFVIVIFLLNCIHFSMVFACRYTVREIGFTDLASSPYVIYFYTSKDMAEEIVTTFRRISYAALLDANIGVAIINVDEQKDHPAMEYFNFWKGESNPVAILVSPEGQSIVLPLEATDQSFKEAVWSTIESIVSSPTQKRILEGIVKSFGIVLFIEGKDAAKNKKARQKVSRAIKEISSSMRQMPKPVNEPPQLIVIPYQAAAEEKIILWSLGLNQEIRDEPSVAVLYGRGRRMGPIVKGDQIKENTIFNLLAIVGADCECGLDRSWMLGMMIPLRWGADAQNEVVKLLGFDAENPMVKAEMSQILSIAPSAKSAQSFYRGEENLFGYSEGIVEFDNKATVPTVPLSQFQEINSPKSFGMGSALVIIGGISLLILVGGAFILIRSQRRK